MSFLSNFQVLCKSYVTLMLLLFSSYWEWDLQRFCNGSITDLKRRYNYGRTDQMRFFFLEFNAKHIHTQGNCL